MRVSFMETCALPSSTRNCLGDIQKLPHWGRAKDSQQAERSGKSLPCGLVGSIPDGMLGFVPKADADEDDAELNLCTESATHLENAEPTPEPAKQRLREGR